MRTEVRQSKALKGRKPRSSGRTPRLSEAPSRGKGTALRRESKTAPSRRKAGTTFGEATAPPRGGRSSGAQFGELPPAREVPADTGWPQCVRVHSEADILGRS